MRAVVVGDNFRFGHKQAGNTEVLRALGERFGFTTEVIPAVTVRGVLVIQQRIAPPGGSRQGDSRGAPAGPSVQPRRAKWCRGHGVGHKQTVPTLNLRPSAEVLPKTGVYVTCTRRSGQRRAMAVGDQRRLPAHVRRDEGI